MYTNESISAKLPYFEVKLLESKMNNPTLPYASIHAGQEPKLFDNENSLLTFIPMVNQYKLGFSVEYWGNRCLYTLFWGI